MKFASAITAVVVLLFAHTVTAAPGVLKDAKEIVSDSKGIAKASDDIAVKVGQTAGKILGL
jgi:hypothetical protein